MFKKKPTASEVDGVQYRRAKLWQIICYACNGLVGMSVYSLIGMASYSASIGYGITTAAVGIILTCSRILDGITDPLLAFVYDRVNTKFGKLRILMVAGFLIEALALYGMFTGFSSKGLGLPVFALLYIVYIIGYTITNMTAQTIPAIMTNDPRQRPTIGVWTTVFNYMVPMVMSMVLNVVLLPKCGGTYNQAFLTAACNITLIVAAIGTLLVCLGGVLLHPYIPLLATLHHNPLDYIGDGLVNSAQLEIVQLVDVNLLGIEQVSAKAVDSNLSRLKLVNDSLLNLGVDSSQPAAEVGIGSLLAAFLLGWV